MHFARIHRHRWLIALTLAMVVGLGSAVWQVVGQESASVPDPEALAKAQSLSRAFRAAAQTVMPTVVKITSTTNARVVQDNFGQPFQGGNPFEGTPFEDFFNEQMPDLGRQLRTMPRQGLGSGVIIDPKGIIVTNNHVVAGADKVTVELSDGSKYDATDITTDESTDLAILRIKADKPLPAARLGDSESLQIGDWVLAVGNPFDLDLTVSAGIISGKERSLRANQRATYIQTDAAINPGNSGGPLVSLSGEVVGINTAIASSNGQYQGVGFAIPSVLVKRVTDDLVKNGKVERAYLGVGISATDSDVGRRLGVADQPGVLIGSVYHGSPAEVAGLQVGDVIQKFAGRDVTSPPQLQSIVEQSPARSTQKIQVLRDGKPKTLDVVIQPLPDDLQLASAVTSGDSDKTAGIVNRELGFEVGDLTSDAAAEFGVRGTPGVLITAVDPQGIAATSGIERGMVIVAVDRQPVASLEEYSEAVQGKSAADGVLLTIRAKDGERLILLQQS